MASTDVVKPPVTSSYGAAGVFPGADVVIPPVTSSYGAAALPAIGPKDGGGVGDPLSLEALRGRAESEIGAEISGETGILKGELGTLQGRMDTALGGLNTMFGDILPYVQGSADRVRQAYDTASNQVQGIYGAAQQRMSQLKQQRAQEAQAMAQEMGGPVAISEFMASVLPAETQLASAAPNAMLHALGMAQAGTQQAEAFAGKVFPLVRTEAEVSTRRGFEEDMAEIRKQIAGIEGGKTGRVNKRLSEIQTQEREFDLQKKASDLQKLQSDRDWNIEKKRLTMDQTKAARDWKAAQATLKADKERLKLAQKEFELQQAGVTGKYGGKPTQAAKEAQAAAAAQLRQDKLTAKKYGLEVQEYRSRLKEAEEAAKVAKQNRIVDQRKMAMDIVDAAISGNPTTIKRSGRIEITERSGVLNKKAYEEKDKDGKTHWYLPQTTEDTVATATPINNPDRLYAVLLGYQIPKAMATELVRSRLSAPSWAPGKKQFSAQEIGSMPFGQVRGLAIQYGFVPDPKKPRTREWMENFIKGKMK